MSPDDILDAYTLCEGVQSVPDGDVIMLLKYQKDMMELLPKSAKWIAETEYALNKKKSEIANAEENLDLQWNQLKLKIEGQCADELKLVKLCDRLNATVTHLLDSLKIRIPAERRLQEMR